LEVRLEREKYGKRRGELKGREEKRGRGGGNFVGYRNSPPLTGDVRGRRSQDCGKIWNYGEVDLM
jgi:hypothetical protein